MGGDRAVASVVSECEEVGWVIRGDFHRFRNSHRALIICFMAHFSVASGIIIPGNIRE